MNKYRKIIVVFVGLFVLTITVSVAQIGHGGVPYSFKKNAILSQPDVELLPYLDNKILLEEEIASVSKQEGFIFGKEIKVDYRLDNSGLWEDLNGGRLWRLSVQSTGAYSLNLIFDKFYIPPHSNLFIYTEDKSFVMGKFTEENNNQWGNFATSLFPGDAIVLEYYEDSQDYGQGIIQLTTIVHGHKDFFFKKGTYGSSKQCNIDANCEEGNKYPYAKRATALILSANKAYCSGTLMNNTARDGKPYFLTAFHCIDVNQNRELSQKEIDDAQKWVFVFNYESTDCNESPEKQKYSINGAKLLAAYPHSDFALFLLNNKPTKDFNAYYAGWDRRNIATAGAFCFHHPNGDTKKISKNNKLLDSSKWDEDDYIFPDNTHWKVTSWDMGTTEGGSSGSALFNVLEQVIGQLEGGIARCNGTNPDNGYDLYGKFSYSWTNDNNTGRNRLDYWLDSLGTGEEVIQGYDHFQKSNAIYDFNESIAKISLSPNPANNKVRIEANSQILSYTIYAISGQRIKSETINSWSIDLNVKDLSDGIYIIELQTKNGTVHKKLAVQR